MPADLLDTAVGASRPTAARVIGVTEHRLREWSRRTLLEPSVRQRVGKRTFVSYSLDDLVYGRIVALLADRRVPVPQIARIVRAVRDAGVNGPLSSLRWAVAGREAFVEINGTWYGGKRPDQGVLIETLDVEEIRTEARRHLRRPAELAGQTHRRRGVQRSREVFAGTRVPVATVERYVHDGRTNAEILDSFPSLYPADVDVVRRRLAS